MVWLNTTSRYIFVVGHGYAAFFAIIEFINKNFKEVNLQLKYSLLSSIRKQYRYRYKKLNVQHKSY